MKHEYVASLLLCGVIVLAMGVFGQDGMMPVEGLRFPLSYYDDGSIKTQLTAGKAEVPEEGDVISGQDVKVEFFSANGAVDVVMRAAECLYNKKTGLVTSKDDVALEKPDIRITGTGMKWDPENETVELLSDVKVVLKRTFKMKSRASESGRVGR